MTKKKRVILDFNPEEMDMLDKLCDSLGEKTRTATIRRAIHLLKLSDDKQGEGYILMFKKGNQIIEVVII